ncbi:O-antigen ligase family protein [Maricaulis salignorans]|uniref:O-antigen ligase n=1 Tax=Maricaulis salignorans TaxID=144026 RepID=A0A1G9LXB7_9PROT|nr:O-antigen ligase family protein [Maricaulis salignorans]SDL66680.1 O-antigen ligase [Maricaulis salignorans]
MFAYISLGLIGLAAFTALGADSEMASYFYGAPLLLIGGWVAWRDRELGTGAAVLLAIMALFLGIAALRGQLLSGAPEFVALGACAAVFISARALAFRARKATEICAVLLGFFLLASIIAFLDHIWSPDRIFLFERPYHLGRLSSPFLSANTAATFFGIGVILSVGRLLRATAGPMGGARSKHLILPLTTLLFCLSCLVLTASRAGILLTGSVTCLLLLWEMAQRFRRGERQSLWALAAAGLGLALTATGIALLSGETFGSRIADVGVGAGSRSELWTAYSRAALEQFWFGAGPGGFEYVNAASTNAENASILVFQRAAHNIVLQWQLQTGLIGLLTLAGFWLWAGRRILSGLEQSGRPRWLIRTLVCIGLFVLAHGLVDYALEIPAIAWMTAWLAGLAVGVSAPRGKAQSSFVRHAVGVAMLLLAAGAVLGLVDTLRANAVRAATGDPAAAILAAPFPQMSGLALARAHADLALSSTPANPGHARAALDRVLALEPRDGRAEARLAYALLLAGDSQAAANHLSRSFQLWPYAHPDFRTWRLQLSASLWNRLGEEERRAALRELRQVRPEWRRPWLEQTRACELGGQPACIGLGED